jgi:hypothetical protein
MVFTGKFQTLVCTQLAQTGICNPFPCGQFNSDIRSGVYKRLYGRELHEGVENKVA